MSSQNKAALKSKFLAGLSAEERAHTFALTGQLARPLTEWMARYPDLMRTVRVPQFCMTLAAAGPFLQVPELLPAARMVAWIFAVDDLVDEGNLPAAELWPRLERSPSLFDDPEGADTGGDPLLEALRDIREELRGFPLFATMRPHLANSLREMLHGMRREQEWSTRFQSSPRRPLPTFDDYVNNGRYSLGVFPVYVCLLITMGDASVGSHLKRLFKMEREAAISIRLANDLRSHQKEVAEGKLNSLRIRQLQRKGLGEKRALAQARAVVNARISLGMKRCLKLCRRKTEHTDSLRPERYLVNLVSFACDFYTRYDYHQPVVRQNG